MAIEERLGKDFVLRADGTEFENIIARFENEPAIQFLVLDRSGEEGLNLHFAHTLIYGDLPYSVERLEQRVGRSHRFGRRHTSLPQYVVLPTDEDGPWIAWLELLQQGFGLFNRSVSDVQFVLKLLEHEIEMVLLLEGASGLKRLTEKSEVELTMSANDLMSKVLLMNWPYQGRPQNDLSRKWMTPKPTKQGSRSHLKDGWWKH